MFNPVAVKEITARVFCANNKKASTDLRMIQINLNLILAYTNSQALPHFIRIYIYIFDLFARMSVSITSVTLDFGC